MIIDTHVHFYDPERPQGIPWPPPNDELLYRTSMPEHFKAIAVPEGVSGTVVVEASKLVEDNQWILNLAADEPFIVGFVGSLLPGSEDFGKNLDRFAANPIFRGIRVRDTSLKILQSEALLNDIEKLVSKDLELDVILRPEQLCDLAAFSERLPELRIVINHIAGARIDGKTPDPVWVDGMRQVAAHPRVFCKVSALVEATQSRPAPIDSGYYTPTLNVLWNAFGEDRLIYGSNWTPCIRYADYATVLHIVKEYFEAKGEVTSQKFFWKNAKMAYKWVNRNA